MDGDDDDDDDGDDDDAPGLRVTPISDDDGNGDVIVALILSGRRSR